MKFTEISKTKLTEAFDNPYPFKLTGPDDSQEFVATANTPNGPLRMDFETTDYDNFGIDFSIGKSMGKTDAGDEFRVFATVVAIMKKWISTVGIEHVESFDFGANKDEHASDGRAKLYTRFAKQLASQLGWKLEQSTTHDGGTAFFRLVNPKPVKREQEYWDAIEESNQTNAKKLKEEKYTTAFLKKLIAKAEAMAEKDFSQYTPADHQFMDKFFDYHLPNMINQFGELAGLATPLLQSKYHAFNEASKEEFDAIRNGYVDIEFDKKWWPLSSDYPLIKHIGKAIGATSWTSWGKVGVPWSEKEMIGGGGTYMLKGDFGHILLDASKSYRPDQILMSQVSTSNRGGGVGVKVMNALKSYADQNSLPLVVYKVTNKKFFDKFEWLEQTNTDTYEYKPSGPNDPKEGLVNEETGEEMLSIFQDMHHDSGANDEMDAFIKSHDWKLADFTPDMFPSEEEFFDYDDPFGRVIDIDYHHRVDMSQPIIVGPQHKDGKYSVIDGNHRAAKATELGKTIKGYFPVKANTSVNEGYKLKLERDADMMVLNITDTKTGKRTEVRGKSGYETNGYDANDKLHQLLDKISKSANISELMNGELVGINPKHPDGASAKSATTKAFNENVTALASELEKKYNLKSLFLGDMASRNAIELHSIIVNKEEQGQGTGSKVMQELIAYADANEKIMVLDPGLLDKQHGTTSQSRLRKFYKRFGFIDNKGRNKNYEFRNLMIRYPQTNELEITDRGQFASFKIKNPNAPVEEAVTETAGVGRVVKGVNTTVDVGVDEIINQVKKFGNDVDRDGKPQKFLKR